MPNTLEKLVENTAKPITKTLDGLYNIFLGMFTVVKHVSRDPITTSYPEKCLSSTPEPVTDWL